MLQQAWCCSSIWQIWSSGQDFAKAQEKRAQVFLTFFYFQQSTWLWFVSNMCCPTIIITNNTGTHAYCKQSQSLVAWINVNCSVKVPIDSSKPLPPCKLKIVYFHLSVINTSPRCMIATSYLLFWEPWHATCREVVDDPFIPLWNVFSLFLSGCCYFHRWRLWWLFLRIISTGKVIEQNIGLNIWIIFSISGAKFIAFFVFYLVLALALSVLRLVLWFSSLHKNQNF